METIAVYWEERVRTYGFNLLEGVTLCRFSLPAGSPRRWHALDRCPDHPAASFRLCWAQAEPGGGTRFYLVSDKKDCQAQPAGIDMPAGRGSACDRTAVDLLFFQGPHFGDRYGIVDFTFQALPANVTPLGMVCATATIYLVLPAGQGRPARETLRRSFDIPVSAGKNKSTAV